MEQKRLGFVGIVIEDRLSAPEVNRVLSDYAGIILARMGLPYEKRTCAVITVIVDTDTDTLGQFTGKLGQIVGVSVKSALSKIQ